MKHLSYLILFLSVLSCTSKDDSSENIQDEQKAEAFPYEYSEKLPEVEFAFPFDYAIEYDLLFQGDSLIENTSVDAITNSNPKVLAIVEVDSSVYFLVKELKERIEGAFDLHLLVRSNGVGIIPIKLDLFGESPGCFFLKSHKLFTLLKNKKGELLVESEQVVSFDDKLLIAKAYLDELTFLRSCETIDASEVDSLLCTPFKNTFTVVNFGMYYQKFSELTIGELAEIYAAMLLIEKERVLKCVGRFDAQVYDSLSPKFLLNNYTLPPPPPIASEVEVSN